MKRLLTGTFSLAIAIAAFGAAIPAQAATAGGACAKAGATTKITGKVYVCQKNSKKKLVWTKKSVPIATKPTALPSPAAPKPFEYQLPAEYKTIFAGSDWVQSPKPSNGMYFGHYLFDYFSDYYSKNFVDSTLESVKKSGVGWTGFYNFYTYSSLEPPKLIPYQLQSGRDMSDKCCITATDAELTSMIKKAHAEGLKFELLSSVNFDALSPSDYVTAGVDRQAVSDKAEQRLQDLGAALSNPTPAVTKFWDDWFQTYGDYLAHQADIAQSNGVEMLSIGQQLGPVTNSANADRWRALITRVREHYKGPLTYGALEGKGFGEAVGFPVWPELDTISMVLGGLAPATKGQSLAQIRDAFKVVLDERYKPIATQYGKKIILLTYFQAATTQEWFEPAPLAGGHAFITKDQLAQAKLYEALFQTIQSEDWVAGVFSMGYFYKDDLTYLFLPGDSAFDKSANVRDQPAMEIIRRWAQGK